MCEGPWWLGVEWFKRPEGLSIATAPWPGDRRGAGTEHDLSINAGRYLLNLRVPADARPRLRVPRTSQEWLPRAVAIVRVASGFRDARAWMLRRSAEMLLSRFTGRAVAVGSLVLMARKVYK